MFATARTVVTASLVAALSLGTVAAVAPATTGSFVGSAAAATEQQQTRTVLNQNGEEVVIPAEITRVGTGIGAFNQIVEMLGQGNGKLVAAVTENVNDDFLKVFPDYSESNPKGYSSLSVEDLIAADAQVVCGPSRIFSEEQLAQLEQAGIAFVAIDSLATVDELCQATLIIGEVMGEEELEFAEQFVEYFQTTMEESIEATKDIPEDERPTILQIWPSGDVYTTTNKTDICQQYMEAAGAVNVAADFEGSGRQLEVSAEQILEWNPDYIIVRSVEGREMIMKDPALQQVTAVQNDDVYCIPTGLFLWSARSDEGVLMVPWLNSILNPDLFPDIDMEQVVSDFFKDFYGYELPQENLEAILNGETHI